MFINHLKFISISTVITNDEDPREPQYSHCSCLSFVIDFCKKVMVSDQKKLLAMIQIVHIIVFVLKGHASFNVWKMVLNPVRVLVVFS